MNRVFSVVCCVLAVATLSLAQEAAAKPQVPEDAFSTRELVAWSSLQKPHPTPQPLPPPDKPIPQQDRAAQTSAGPAAQESPATSFIGKIVKESGSYVLKVATGTVFHLAGEGDVTPYENKSVKVLGDLDAATNTIHVNRIELLS